VPFVLIQVGVIDFSLYLKDVQDLDGSKEWVLGSVLVIFSILVTFWQRTWLLFLLWDFSFHVVIFNYRGDTSASSLSSLRNWALQKSRACSWHLLLTLPLHLHLSPSPPPEGAALSFLSRLFVNFLKVHVCWEHNFFMVCLDLSDGTVLDAFGLLHWSKWVLDVFSSHCVALVHPY
jgi:hypothetical protein